MASYRLMRWQDIPLVVEASEAGKVHKERLSARFQELIDLVAMKQGLAGTDDYLEHWNRTAAQEREGPPEEVAKALATEIESRFGEIQAVAWEASRRKRQP
jgi:hypothetical protein